MAAVGDGQNSGLPSSLAAAVALLVAALAGIGLTGVALLRAVRNNPDRLVTALTWALVGGGIIAAAQLLPLRTSTGPSLTKSEVTSEKVTIDPADPKKEMTEKTASTTNTWSSAGSRARVWPGWVRLLLSLIGVALLLFAVRDAIIAGAGAVAAREGPLVTLQAGAVSAIPGAATARNVEVTVSVRAVGMTTTNDVAVQVLGISDVPRWIDKPSVEVCESNHTFNGFGNYSALPEEGKATLLSWNRIGPDASGSVDASWKLQVPAGRYVALCAWSIFGGDLSQRIGNNTSAAYLRLGLQN